MKEMAERFSKRLDNEVNECLRKANRAIQFNSWLIANQARMTDEQIEAFEAWYNHNKYMVPEEVMKEIGVI